MSAAASPLRLLTIAGSDSGGGAGIQADLKTFAAHGGYGMSVVTAITAQNTVAVTAVHDVPAQVVEAQIEAVFEDIGADAVKIGMLSSVPIIHAVVAGLQRYAIPEGVPIVLDPVMVSKSGAALLREDAVETLLRELLPLATLITPNLPEAARLLRRPATELTSEAERLDALEELRDLAPAVLLKGGHGDGAALVDWLHDGEAVHRFEHARVETLATHGTGCTLSSAIAARLGRSDALAEAVAGAIDYLQGALRRAYPLGNGHGPVDHLYELFPRNSLQA